MRKILLISILTSTTYLYPQYGQEGIIIVAGEGVIRATEMVQYNKIAKVQDDILTYQALVMTMTAELTRIEQLKLKSETKVAGWIGDLKSIIEIGLQAQRLLELQIEINDIASESPDLAPYITEAMVGIVQESIVLVTDYKIALKEAKENLMPPKDRIDILNLTSAGLEHLARQSAKILIFTHELANVSEFDGLGIEPATFDFTEQVQNAEGRIGTFIK